VLLGENDAGELVEPAIDTLHQPFGREASQLIARDARPLEIPRSRHAEVTEQAETAARVLRRSFHDASVTACKYPCIVPCCT